MIAPVYSQRQVSPAVEEALRAAMAPLAVAENARMVAVMGYGDTAKLQRARKTTAAARSRATEDGQREMRETIIRMARDGVPDERIAAVVNRSRTRVRFILNDERKRGTAIPDRRKAQADRVEAEKARVLEMRRAGRTNREIREELGTSRHRVEKMLASLRREGRL